MTSKVLVALCLASSILSGALAGTAAVWWLRPEPASVPSARTAAVPTKSEAAPRAAAVDGDVDSRITEIEDRLEAYQAQLRARRNLEKYAEAVAADNKDEDRAKPRAAGGVVDAEDPAFELAVRSVLDQVAWEKEEERKVTRQQRRQERAQRQVQMYTERLQLSPEQAQTFAGVLGKQMDQLRVMSDEEEGQGPPLTRSERREKSSQIRAETEARLAEVLSPEQFASYRAIVEEQFPPLRERSAPAPSGSIQ